MKLNSNFTNPPQTQIDMINIGHKSLPIIIGPYMPVSPKERVQIKTRARSNHI
jgi:hypothetical protein